MSLSTPPPQNSSTSPQRNNEITARQASSPSHQTDGYLESIQNIPSNFDHALNGSHNQRYLSPNPSKQHEATLLDPETFRRLSISTASSFPHSRNPSPYPLPPKSKLGSFWHRNYGLFLVALSQLFGALMNVTTRLLELEENGMHPLQILFARMGLTMLFCCIWMWWKKVPDFPWGAKGIRGLLMGRGFSGFFGIYGMYYSLQYLPLSDAVVITFLAPSVAAYGCYIFLKEPFPRCDQYASLVSLLGVILIARPTSFFDSPNTVTASVASNATSTDAPYDFPIPTGAQRASAVAVAMLGVLGAAGAFTTVRWIGHRAHPLISVNYFAIWCTFISTSVLVLPFPGSPNFALPANLRQWIMLLFLGICGFVMQFLLTKGLATGGRGEGGRATHMIYTNMLFALGLDRLVFGVSPGWWSLGGSGLILGSAVYVALQRGIAEGPRRESDEEVEVGMTGVELERGGGTVEEEMGLIVARGDEQEERRGRSLSLEESRIP